MENINIAVIGARGAGKSTFVQRALGLRAPSTTRTPSVRILVDAVAYTVTVIEIDLEAFDFNPDRTIQWPKQINGHIVPRVDGIFILYDVMNRDSITHLPQTLNALVQSALPTILVACKCDNPVNTRQIDTNSIEAACLAEVETFRTASNVPESARNPLGAMLQTVMSNRITDGFKASIARRRAASSASPEIAQQTHYIRPSSQQSKHSRASSEFSLLKGFPSPPPSLSRAPISLSRPIPNGGTNLSLQHSVAPADPSLPTSPHLTFRHEILYETPGSEIESNLVLSWKTRKAADASSTAIESFLDMVESDADSARRTSDDLPILERADEPERPTKPTGFTFDELVERLLSQHMSRADSNFADIFLCLYRKFAAPGELFSAILSRLEHIATDTGTHHLIRTAIQLRVITVIAKWVSRYPGDFASPRTNRQLEAFIGQLSLEPETAAAAREMQTELQLNVVEDDDTDWARTDADADAGLDQIDPVSTVSTLDKGKPNAGLAKSASISSITEEKVQKMHRRASGMTTSLGSGDIPSASDGMAQVYRSVQDYEAEAATLVPSSTLPLTKFRYHICMDTPDDDFADEITRIDWVMFSSIRVRDLVRHVSLRLEQKRRCRSLVNVNRMIDHFNHVARWVANMILMRDKAKHRAQMLEKFMRIALRLRQLNNYNGLAAVIAGINGSAVHRLTQTRTLVTPDCQKRFMQLELLMSSQKSHFAYRLAWENSSLPRIPFIPLHRRDLVSAEEGSRTFVGPVGNRINWKKFEILAEVILPIMRSQGTPYTMLERHNIARELILDCRMPTDDEETYQRSLQLESSSSILEPGRIKFPWFQK
ncbi:MAG: hypothetical protein M1818_005445 [Claussenomyces sp. TS43310]|nr:MAG: hypothetical protein M1818_005445 [Claussenomyces sp. TS43310]